mgnify:CR=1 FL=1
MGRNYFNMEARNGKYMRFQSKKAVITGASSGIGREISIKMASEGAEVLLVSRKKEQLDEVCKEIRAFDGNAQYLICDLSDDKDRTILCKTISEIWSDKVDIIVNAAGVQIVRPIFMTKQDIWYQLMEVNVIAPADILSKLLPKLSNGAVVVNIASVAGIVASPGSAVYASTKAALLSFTRTSAVELAGKGIRVNAILPGMVKTPMMDAMFKFYTKDQREAVEKKHLLGFGTPDDIASAVAFIASDEAKWITGCSLVIDGGFTLT